MDVLCCWWECQVVLTAFQWAISFTFSKGNQFTLDHFKSWFCYLLHSVASSHDQLFRVTAFHCAAGYFIFLPITLQVLLDIFWKKLGDTFSLGIMYCFIFSDPVHYVWITCMLLNQVSAICNLKYIFKAKFLKYAKYYSRKRILMFLLWISAELFLFLFRTW